MDNKIIELAKNCKIEPSAILSFVEVETGGKGFDENTGKIIIQFEPVWFRRNAPYAPSGLWSVNKVDVQSKEWKAFNSAFKINPEAAMKSTSIGLGQIMGFNYERIGYKTVNEMWDDAKLGIDKQFNQIVNFILSDKTLYEAIKNHKWSIVAEHYNGKKYKELAKRYKRTPYDISMSEAYDKFSRLLV